MKNIKQYKCVICESEWQIVDGVEVFNSFAFKPSNGQPVLTVCKICRSRKTKENKHSRIQGLKDT